MQCLTFVKHYPPGSSNLCFTSLTKQLALKNQLYFLDQFPMKKYANSMVAIALLGTMLTLFACTTSNQKEVLLQQALALEQRHCQLNASIDSLWDATTAQLKSAMPADFPAIDRDIFLKARNANHIRMFMSFKQLDSKCQALVNQAGQYDEVLAAKVYHLMAEKQQFEAQKNQFLQQLAKKDLAGSQAFAQKIREATTYTCL